MYDFPTTNNQTSQFAKQQPIKINLNKGRRIDYMLQEKVWFNLLILIEITHY